MFVELIYKKGRTHRKRGNSKHTRNLLPRQLSVIFHSSLDRVVASYKELVQENECDNYEKQRRVDIEEVMGVERCQHVFSQIGREHFQK